MLKKSALPALLMAVTLAAGIPVLVGGAGILPLIMEISAGQLVLVFGLIAAAWLLNAARLRILFHSSAIGLTQSRAVATILACDLAAKMTPGGTGAPVMAVTVMRKFGVSTESALAGFLVISVVDAVFIACFMAVLCAVGFDGQLELGTGLAGRDLSWLVYALPLFAAATYLALFRFGWKGIAGIIDCAIRAPKRKKKLFRYLSRLRRGVRALVQTPQPLRYIFLVVVAVFWLVQLSLLHAIIGALGGNVSWVQSVMIQVLSMAAGRLFLLPAGAGGTEATAIILLSTLISAEMAATAVLVWRSLVLLLTALAGMISLAYLSVYSAWRRADGNS